MIIRLINHILFYFVKFTQKVLSYNGRFDHIFEHTYRLQQPEIEIYTIFQSFIKIRQFFQVSSVDIPFILTLIIKVTE